MSRTLSVGKQRRLPPVYAIINRIQSASIDKVQDLVRSADIPKYTYKQQSQIHAAVAEKLKLESEKEDQGSPSLTCHICNKAMDDVTRLRRHLLTHGPRNYRCNFPSCTWTFNLAKDLERHRKKHGITIQVFKCGFQGCGRLMNRRDNARYHIRTVHGIEYGQANALVEVIPIDIKTPDQQLEAAHREDHIAAGVSDVQRELVTEPNPITTTQPLELPSLHGELDEEQNLKDLFTRFTTLDEVKESEGQKDDSDNWSTGKDASEPAQQPPGAERSQVKTLRERVKQVFYTTTRPRPPRFNKRLEPNTVVDEAKFKASAESLATTDSVANQASSSKTPAPTLGGGSLFKGFLSLGTSRSSVDGANIETPAPPAPSKSPKPPTRAPPPPPDQETPFRVRPPTPITALNRSQIDNRAPPCLPPRPGVIGANLSQEKPPESRPLPNQLQISPEFADKLHNTFRSKLQISHL
ncbi:hypothetical protein AOL_s00080g222 [Orbilia oligospora ATCC 24927]|uniref:C2H2-type domain-containing protein n=2 Tax=Orbilia oligospora TaxID=2813651 RepID=G1XEI7_ARTOA|nr:hypothetical protein AOL_s00080g222 [Orbilia oligospora ATCC 24927]EGX48593.1 hypothetical protein AOL_s00080g222 [Orbilia oligospora ATCC 24927]KAF3277017.1 hypothetical protein TWF970_005886 [Orbilia oligospora]